MRLGILIVLAILCASHAARAGCKRGKPMFRIESTPIEGGDTAVLEVRTTGAWTRTGDEAGKGCLSKVRLALVVKAVKAARFARGEGSVCDAVSTENVVYRGAKKHIETQSPCGLPVDVGTAIAATCVQTAVSTAADADVAIACDTAEVCEAGALLFRATSAPLQTGVSSDEEPQWTEARSKGAWSRSDGASGCLSGDHLKLLKRAVKRAKFKKTTPRINCRALPNVELRYEGPKKKQHVTIQAPCADAPDEWTAVAAACLDALAAGASTEENITYACNPEPPE